MMTLNHRKEALSRAYVHALAAAAGVLCSRPDPDYGIDLCLREVEVRDKRLWDTGVQIDVQLKATSKSLLADTEIRYDLDADGYNTLCRSAGGVPRILVLVVLPDDEREWLSQTPDELCLRRCAFWASLEGRRETAARSSVRITIPRADVFSPDVIRLLMDRARSRRTP